MDLKNSTEHSGNFDTSPTSPCGNCNREIRKEKETISVIRIKSITRNKMIDIHIWDVVVHIFGTSWEEYQSYIQNTSKDVEMGTKRNFLSSQTIFLCPSCAALLIECYKAHLKFEQVTHSMSVIRQMKNSRRKLFTSADLISSDMDNMDMETTAFQSDSPEDFSNEEEELKPWANEDEELSTEIKYEPVDPNEMDDNDWQCDGQTVHMNESQTPLTGEVTVKIDQLREEELQQYERKSNDEPNRKIDRRSEMKETIRKSPFGNSHIQIAKEPKQKHSGTGNTGSETVNDLLCHICNKKFSSKRLQKRHIKDIHQSADLKKACKLCGKLVRPTSLRSHMKLHKKRESHSCHQCGKVYLHRVNLEEHLLTHEKDWVPFLCRHCGQTVSSRNNLLVHEKHHDDSERRYACEKCPARFFVKKNFDDHQTTHSSERPFICDQCGKTFKLKRILSVHLKEHQEIAESGAFSSFCDICGRICKTKRALASHVQRLHGTKEFECSFCDKSFPTQNSLSKHEELHAKDEQLFVQEPQSDEKCSKNTIEGNP